MKSTIRALLILSAALWLAGCKEGRDAYAVTTTDTIIKFQTDDAGKIQSEATISGTNADETLQQIDFRPHDGLLYGMTSEGYLVTVNADTGLLTRIGTPISTTALSNIVIDVNPQGDYLRVIATRPVPGDSSGATQFFNARVAFDTAAVTVDSTSLSFNSNDTNVGEIPSIVGIAHTNDRDDSSSTVEYGLELTTQTMVKITNAGVLSTIGPVDKGFTSSAGFDIVRDRGDNDGDTGSGYAALADANGDAKLYDVDISSGSASKSDGIGDNRQVRSLAVSLDPPKRKGFFGS